MIPIEDLKTNLKLQGIDIESLTDDDLTSWVDLKKDELISLTGIPLDPISRKQIISDFKGNFLELDYYPVDRIRSLRIGGYCLKENKDYTLDDNAGIIYLHKSYNGLLVVEFIQQISYESIEQQIIPLISDMILYTLKNKDNNFDGVISNIRESEQSISYDTSNSLGNRIYTRIDSLKTKYSSYRVKLLR